MRKVANRFNKKLRRDQFEVLIDIIDSFKTKGDLSIFLKNFLTASELAVLEQRLDIMRLLSKHLNYPEIKRALGVAFSTIAHAANCLEKGGRKLRQNLALYEFTQKPAPKNSDDQTGYNYFKAIHPGAIRRSFRKKKY